MENWMEKKMGFKWSVVTNWNTVIYSDSTTHDRFDLGD